MVHRKSIIHYLFCDQIRRYGPQLTLLWVTCLDTLCFFWCPGVRRREEYSTSGAVITQYRQIHLPIYSVNAASSEWSSSQINCHPCNAQHLLTKMYTTIGVRDCTVLLEISQQSLIS